MGGRVQTEQEKRPALATVPDDARQYEAPAETGDLPSFRLLALLRERRAFDRPHAVPLATIAAKLGGGASDWLRIVRHLVSPYWCGCIRFDAANGPEALFLACDRRAILEHLEEDIQPALDWLMAEVVRYRSLWEKCIEVAE